MLYLQHLTLQIPPVPAIWSLTKANEKTPSRDKTLNFLWEEVGGQYVGYHTYAITTETLERVAINNIECVHIVIRELIHH